MGDSAVVVWMGEVGGGEGCVDYEIDGGEPQQLCGDPDEEGQYEIRIEGLPADVPVTYTISVGERSAGPFTFYSALSDDSAVKILVTADTHANTSVITPIMQAGLAEGVHMAVVVGDLVSQPEEDQWDAFFDGLRAFGHEICLWPVQGNHEAKHRSFFHHFVMPEGAVAPREPEDFYAARVGQVWFAGMELFDWTLHAFSLGGDTDEVVYLREQLQSEAARTARWRVLFLHQPPWAMGWGHCDGYDGEGTLREYLLPFAVEHDIDIMFFGHMHGYERGTVDGVKLVTTGGGGGSLDHECPHDDWPEPWLGVYEHHFTIVEAGCDELTVTARTLDGEIIDQFVIE